MTARSAKQRRRLDPLAVLVPLLRAAERISPRLAARLAAPLMFRTERPPSVVRRPKDTAPGASSTLRVGKGHVAVTRWGTSGPVVLLVHGWNGFAAQLAAFVPPLCDAGFQVVAFDAPGHGDSSGQESSLIHFADALDAVAASVAPHGPIAGIVAHSFGCAGTAFALDRRATGRAARAAADLSDVRLVFIVDGHVNPREFGEVHR